MVQQKIKITISRRSDDKTKVGLKNLDNHWGNLVKGANLVNNNMEKNSYADQNQPTSFQFAYNFSSQHCFFIHIFFCRLKEIPNLKLSLLATSDVAKYGFITERA